MDSVVNIGDVSMVVCANLVAIIDCLCASYTALDDAAEEQNT